MNLAELSKYDSGLPALRAVLFCRQNGAYGAIESLEEASACKGVSDVGEDG